MNSDTHSLRDARATRKDTGSPVCLRPRAAIILVVVRRQVGGGCTKIDDGGGAPMSKV